MAAETSAPLVTSPLHDRNVELGAKFAEFAGWQMPLEYTGSVKEHVAVRTAVGIFDVSHLGKVFVRGAGAAEYVNRCLANDLDRVSEGQAQYTLCCEEDGGVVDDLIAYLRGPDEVLLIPNAANAAEVAERLSAAAPEGVEVIDEHRAYAVLAVQGPKSGELLSAIGLPVDHAYMSFVDVDRLGVAVTVCRTGYTGELGYELVVSNEGAGSLWDAIVAAAPEFGGLPAGLAARDMLRTEMGYPLHGQDISRSITPVQARLGWAVGWDKPEFWGRAALTAERAAGPSRLLRGLVCQTRGIPRPGMRVSSQSGDPLGHVTSGTYSPTLRLGVALALLDPAVAVGDEVDVDLRGRPTRFTVTKPPFVHPTPR